MGGVEAGRDAQATSVGQDEFEGQSCVGVVMVDVDGEEGNWRAGLVVQAVALPKGSSPGVEGRDGEAMALAEDADRESAVLPAVEEFSPVLLLTGIAGVTLWHR